MASNGSLGLRKPGPRGRLLTICTWLAALLLVFSLAASGPALSASPESKGKPGASAAVDAAKAKGKKKDGKASAEKSKKRAEAVTALAARLGLGPGGTVADIGAGNGPDTWVFAKIVGPTGKVYAEEITEKQVKSLKEEAEKKELPQVCPTLGRDDDPALPAGCVDLAHMRLVYHHLSKPREMLRGVWKALKPGGYFVVIDRQRGTLHDWVPREQRKDKHFWIAETTVVREAREEGFAFVGFAEDCCDIPEAFVLVFQRPKDLSAPGRDPDGFAPLAIKDIVPRLPRLKDHYQRPVFIALGEARQFLPSLLERSGGKGLEIVLEEWATQKEERPPLPAGVSLPSVLTDLGDPHLGPEPIDAVFFLDSYHLLFHGKTLLAALRDKITPDGCVYIMDRAARGPFSRREASHRRQIQPETVKQEMADAGFSLLSEGPRPAPDRVLLVFGTIKPE